MKNSYSFSETPILKSVTSLSPELKHSKYSAMKTHIHLKMLRVTFVTLVLILSVAFGAKAATYTWNHTSGPGAWTTLAYWTPVAPTGGIPAGSDIILPANANDITGVPTISLLSLSVTGSCSLEATSGNTITITGSLSVPTGYTLTMGDGNGQRFEITLSGTATATINGTLNLDAGTLGTHTFTISSGCTLIMGPSGIYNGGAGFALNSGHFWKLDRRQEL